LASLLRGRELAALIEAGVLERVSRMDPPPALGVVLAGDDPASASYVRSKEKACARTGIRSVVVRLGSSASGREVVEAVAALDSEGVVDGILCQLPLPGRADPGLVASAIPPRKDVDGLNPVNVGRLWRGEDCIAPCTPAGIMRLLAHHGIEVRGRRAVVVGRSHIVGRPMAAMLIAADATVTVAHSRTPDLEAVCREADILVSAAGIPGLIRATHVREGAVVVDVGTSRTEKGLTGDVAFEEVEGIASGITPVPGGVGPLTIAMLLENTLKCRAARDSHSLHRPAPII
jgi:methylenetetrahydrofolate dehydrogenase (NADP+)/methenyltetrahydrofolate cyclohydrolase